MKSSEGRHVGSQPSWQLQLACIERAEQDAGPIAQGLNLTGLALVVKLEHLPSQPLRL